MIFVVKWCCYAIKNVLIDRQSVQGRNEPLFCRGTRGCYCFTFNLTAEVETEPNPHLCKEAELFMRHFGLFYTIFVCFVFTWGQKHQEQTTVVLQVQSAAGESVFLHEWYLWYYKSNVSCYHFIVISIMWNNQQFNCEQYKSAFGCVVFSKA